MQIEYGHGVAQAPSDLLVQLAHRATIVATLLTAALIGLAMYGTDCRPLTISAVIATDIAVVVASIALVLAYRGGLAMRELLAVLFVSLVLAQLAIWALIKPLGVIGSIHDLSAWIAAK